MMESFFFRAWRHLSVLLPSLAGGVQTQNGNRYRNISASITGLIANRIYHFRIKGSNANGTTFGADGTFTTQ